ncbi:MAG: hypothetical protein UFA98_01040 [Ruminococcus sp.]|nr:hypothetical protein [Ruminococcus sp.]
MTYYPSGSISAYKKLRKIVDGCFSDPTRRPFVSLMKTRGEVKIIIFNDKTKSETIIPINDVEKLNRMYERLYRMAFVRR